MLGVTLTPFPPDVVQWSTSSAYPPAEADRLLEELRARKPEVFAELTRWDDATERARLDAAFDWADAEPGRQRVAWCDAWAASPPELSPLMDEALDTINDAWRHRDVAAHCAAVAAFARVVAVILNVYQLTPAEGRRVPA